MEASLQRKLQTPFCRSSSNFISSLHPIAKYTKNAITWASPWHLAQLQFFVLHVSCYFFVQSQLKKIRWKSTWTSPSLRQLNRVHLSQSASYLAVHLVLGKCFVYMEVFQSLSSLFSYLHNNREPLSPLRSPPHPPRRNF